MVSIIFLVCIPFNHRYVDFQASQQPWNIVLFQLTLCCECDSCVLQGWPHGEGYQTYLWTSPDALVTLLRSPCISSSYWLYTLPGAKDNDNSCCLCLCDIRCLQNALLTIVYFWYGPWIWSHVTESLSSLSHSLLWAHGSNFSFSVLEEFTKQRYGQKSDLKGDMDGSLFHLSFCICWLFFPLILNFTRICFCVKSISLFERYEM